MIDVTCRGVIDDTRVEGSFGEFVNTLNIAAAGGKQFILAKESLADGGNDDVAINTQLIARIRPVEIEDAFVGRN